MFAKSRHRRLSAAAILIGEILACASPIACAPGAAERERSGSRSAAASAVALTPEMESQVEAFCSDCHALPRPESFARDRWHFEARRGYEFYARSGRDDLSPPPFYQTLAYFRARAPEQVAAPVVREAGHELQVRFRREQWSLDTGPGGPPGIASLQWLRLAPDEEPVLLACDMRYGHVVAIDLNPQTARPPRRLARLRNPCRAEVCDLDADGAHDLVVADLGSDLPADHDRGRVVLLKRRPGTQSYAAIDLATGLGRVADVRPADFDGDGALDLVVAEFGWRRTGRIFLLRNLSTPGEDLRFELEEIDDRPGAIHVPIYDFNRDGRPDVAALVSQEYETIDLFLNRGRGTFARDNVWAAPDLTFGSTGIELADLNEDGEIDVLYTNGDSFDSSYASPWHGVQWLENRGGLEFVYHRLADVPGAYGASSGDFDGDGDRDVIVVPWLPPDVQPAWLKQSSAASIIILEQTEPGTFSRHTLLQSAPWYASLAVGDFDRDGDPDFVVAPGPILAQRQEEARDLMVWWNETAQ